MLDATAKGLTAGGASRGSFAWPGHAGVVVTIES